MAFRLLNGGVSPANCARKMAGPLIVRIARSPVKARGNYGKSRSFAALRRSFATRAFRALPQSRFFTSRAQRASLRMTPRRASLREVMKERGGAGVLGIGVL